MLWAVIMAGGSGTRFWPESRENLPKQFLKIFGRETLLEQTVNRIAGVIPKSRILVVTQQSKAAEVRKLLGLGALQVIGEPRGRNTAPCAALAAMIACKKDPEAVIALLPSDHRIGNPGRFRKLLCDAAAVTVQSGMPVTFGIKPDGPHTGYGYLEMAGRASVPCKSPVYRLKRFCEKPSLAKARAFLKSGRYLWNSGMFVWRAADLIAAAKQHQPQIFRTGQRIMSGNFSANLKRFFGRMTSISIDYGLMEPLKGRIFTIPADINWSDLGGWQSFAELWPADRQGNVVLGEALAVESRNNLVKSGQKLVALFGVNGLVVVDTKDALLICPRERSEEVRKIVDGLRASGRKSYL